MSFQNHFCQQHKKMSDPCLKRLLFLSILSLLFISPSLISAHEQEQPKTQNHPFGRTTRFLLEVGEDEDHHPKITTKKNQTKPTPNPSSKLIKSTTNHTPTSKPIKTPSSSSPPNTNKTQSHLKKLNPTSDLPKNNKTTKPTTSKETKAQMGKKPNKAQQKPNSIDEVDDDDDLVSGFRDLPSKFQETIGPDLTTISKTSKVYLNRYNREFTRGFKPYVGSKYASTFASYALFAVILIPLIIVSLVFNRIKAYFSIQRILIFIQIYLAIYFSILGLSCLATGLEPLRFFYSTSRSTYLCVQVLQTLAYVLYLLLLLMYLILVFSTETGPAAKMLGLGQTFVGFAVGLHYYMTVFHRAVSNQPPKSSWKVHGIYATCYVVICLLGGVETRKKAYLEEGGGEGKKN